MDSDTATTGKTVDTTAWKAGLSVVLVLLALTVVLRLLLVHRRRAALDSVPPSPAAPGSAALPRSSQAMPAPPSYSARARRRNPAANCFRSASAFLRPFSSSYVDEDALRDNGPAAVELRRQHNLAIQQALVDAGLLLPPVPRPGRRQHAASGGCATRSVPGTIAGAPRTASAAVNKDGRASRLWRWFAGSPDEGSRVSSMESLQSATSEHSAAFAMSSLERAEERAARALRRERRREEEAVRREEAGIALGLPAYTKEKGENEQVLMREGVDSQSDTDTDTDDEGLEVVARPDPVVARDPEWDVQRRV